MTLPQAGLHPMGSLSPIARPRDDGGVAAYPAARRGDFR